MTTTTTLVTCPGCGDALEPGYVTNTVYYEGDQIKVCDACQEVEFRQCCGCGKWHHKDEVTSDYYGYWCERCMDRRWKLWA
jgi:hypothetical protein